MYRGGDSVHLNIHIISYIRYNMESQACKIKFTCLWSNLHIFWYYMAAKIEFTVTSSLAAPDPRKKPKQFWDPKRTLFSRHQCNKLRTNVKHYNSSWKAQLHFELSNIVNGQNIKKLYTLNEEPRIPVSQYGPIEVKLLFLKWWMQSAMRFFNVCITVAATYAHRKTHKTHCCIQMIQNRWNQNHMHPWTWN